MQHGYLKQLCDEFHFYFAFKINYSNVDFPLPGVEALYNGNIAETQWQVDSDNNVRSYGYQYDPLNRLLKANYKKNNFETRSYDETLTYDKNGNIRTLLRNGSADYDDVGMAFPIDNLKYTYSVLKKSNQLIAVLDYENSTEDFNDVNKVGADFIYNSFGNMTKDLNKNITSIKYNHLNLPTQIKFNTDGANEITYLYNAVGVKVGKKVKSTTPGIGVVENKTDYLNGFQYLGGKLQFFPTVEGYVKAGKDDKLSYVYNYTDHLGNVRVSYRDLDKNGILGDEIVTACSDPDPGTGLSNCRSSFSNPIIEENHYYPFGLEHKGYDYSNSQENYQYKYNGKEYQDELNLNLYDYGARNYDPALGRWMNVDPLAEDAPGLSPYVYCENNPLNMTDPDGRWPYPIGPISLVGLYYKAKSYFSGSSSSSRSSSIGGGGGSGQGGIMLANSKGGSSGQTDLIRKGGRQGSDVMWGDASGFVQTGSFATSMRDGIKYNGSLKSMLKITKEVVKGVKIGNKGGDKLDGGSNSSNSATDNQNDNNSPVSSTNNGKISVDVFDTSIITDAYGDPSNPIPFQRTKSTDLKVDVPNNKKSIDSVKKVYENKENTLRKKVNSQWD